MTIQTTTVSEGSRQLEAVKQLWRKNSETLGFFPDGAFAEYARKGQVIAAERDGQLIGYTLFRRTATRAAIVHLCVEPAARGSGVARQLVEAITRAAPDSDGISLRCRLDFDAHAVWPKLGFRPIKMIAGKGKGGSVLTVWFKSHGNPDLFTFAANQREPRTVAVIDANVFYDLACSEGRLPGEAQALQADWLRDLIELKVTNELFSEIQRADDPRVRRQNVEFANQFDVTSASDGDLRDARAAVDEVLPLARNPRDESDRAHLATCIATRVSYFVTRDDLLLDHSDALYERTHVSVLRPSEFVAEFDEFERADAYRPARLEGTSMRLVPAKNIREEDLADAFRSQQRRTDFLRALRERIATPRIHSTYAVVAEGRPIALVSVADGRDACLRVGLLRVAGPEARTLASYLAHHLRVEALERGASFVLVDDAGMDGDTRIALGADEYVHAGTFWSKVVCGVVGARQVILSWIAGAQAGVAAPEVRSTLEQLIAEGLLDGEVSASLLERKLWPAKVLDGTVPTFVVPIRPHWAHHLFDAELARLDLFGAQKHLAMSRENVYYRSPSNPSTLPSPARVLWYVSGDELKPGTKAIRACSRLVEVTSGPPKPVFRAGRRLGIYAWNDVATLARNSRGGLVQALRFCDTECFRNPVPLDSVRAILDAAGAEGVHPSFPSPQRVPESVFEAIYRAGTGR